MKSGVKFFFIGFLLALPFFWGLNIFQEKLEEFFYAQIGKPFEEIAMVKIERLRKPKLELNVKSVLSIKIDKIKGEKILFEKNSKEILPIASLTKLMTALIVFEDPESYSLSKIIRISAKAASQEDVPEYGNLGTGENKTVGELLNLMLYFSSNDAAFALAEEIGVENFVGRMNKRAMELGLEDTHFSNPTGLDPENLTWEEKNRNSFNYSTARDLAKLTEHIFEEFPIIFEYSNQKSQFSLATDQKIFGIKTGYTDEAGGCMILVFSDERRIYINIILRTESKEERYSEMQKLIDWVNYGKI